MPVELGLQNIKERRNNLKKNRKILGVVLVLSLVALLLPAAIFADDEGAVTCTVSGQLIALTVEDNSIAFGTLDLSTIKNSAAYNVTNNLNGLTLEDTQIITNTGSIAEDFNMKTTNAIGSTNWTLDETPASEKFSYAYNVGGAIYDGSTAITFTKWATADSYVADAGGDDVTASGVKYLELEIGMPTSTVDYAAHTITVTVQAVAHT